MPNVEQNMIKATLARFLAQCQLVLMHYAVGVTFHVMDGCHYLCTHATEVFTYVCFSVAVVYSAASCSSHRRAVNVKYIYVDQDNS